MTRRVDWVSPNATLEEAAQRMKRLDVGALPVCEGGRLLGMITDRDIVVRAIAEGREPERVKVHDVASCDVVVGHEDQGLQEAERLMQSRQVRRLPVVDRDQRLVGIVSLGDLAVRTDDDEKVAKVLEGVSRPSGNGSSREAREAQLSKLGVEEPRGQKGGSVRSASEREQGGIMRNRYGMTDDYNEDRGYGREEGRFSGRMGRDDDFRNVSERGATDYGHRGNYERTVRGSDDFRDYDLRGGGRDYNVGGGRDFGQRGYGRDFGGQGGGRDFNRDFGRDYYQGREFGGERDFGGRDLGGREFGGGRDFGGGQRGGMGGRGLGDEDRFQQGRGMDYGRGMGGMDYGQQGRGMDYGQQGRGMDYGQQGRMDYGQLGWQGQQGRGIDYGYGQQGRNIDYGQQGWQGQQGRGIDYGQGRGMDYGQLGWQGGQQGRGIDYSQQGGQGLGWGGQQGGQQGFQGTQGQGWQGGQFGGQGQGLQQRTMRGPKGYKRSDDRIREDLCDRLGDLHDVDVSDVEVKVQNGEVTLTGTVKDRRFKHVIEQCAESISGVNDVRNEIRTKREEGGLTETRETKGTTTDKTTDKTANEVRTGRNASV